MTQSTIRLILVLEFLLAIIAVFTLWSQVGGQEDLDLVPWHLKLVLACSLAYAIVQATAAAMAEGSPWTGKTMGWLLAVVAIVIVMGALTYYYHVHEPVELGEPSIEGALRL